MKISRIKRISLIMALWMICQIAVSDVAFAFDNEGNGIADLIETEELETEIYETETESNFVQEIVEETESAEYIDEAAIIIVEDEALFGFAPTAAGAPILYHGSVSYGGSTVGHFSVDGVQAFCLQHNKGTPTGSDSNNGGQVFNNPYIKAALYYGISGPGNIFGDDWTRGTVVTSLVLSQIYSGTAPRNIPGYSELLALAQAGVCPSTDASFSQTVVTSSVIGNEKRTEDITLNAAIENTFTLNLPAGLTLHNWTQGTSGTGSVTIRGGDTFCLTAPLDYNVDYYTGELQGSMLKLNPIVYQFDNQNLQHVGRADYVTDPDNPISFTAKFYSEPQTAPFTLKKVDEQNKPLAGAEFDIKDANGAVIKHVVIGNDGFINVEGLLKGEKYTVIETKAPQYYKLDSTPRTIIAGTDTELVIKNELDLTELILKKVDEYGKGIKSVKFKVLDSNNQFVKEVTTGADGIINVDQLINGKVYFLVETEVPQGYLLDSTPHKITAGVDKELKIINKPAPTEVIVNKTDMNGQLISGAKFEIKDANGNTVENITIGADGKATAKNIYCFRKYTLIETAAAPGHLLDTTVYSFTGGQDKELTIANKPAYFRIRLEKRDRESLNAAQGDAVLAGAKYKIYADAAATQVIGELTISEDLTAISEKIAFGNSSKRTIYIKESSAPSGYQLDENTYPVTVEQTDAVTEIYEVTKQLDEDVKKQAFSLIKIGSNGSSGDVELLTAGFSVYLISNLEGVKDGSLSATGENGTYLAEDFIGYDFDNDTTALIYENNIAKPLPEMFTNEDGYLLSPELPYGKYVVIESTVPQNYNPVNPFIVDIKEDSRQPQPWRIFNDSPFEVYLKIQKKDYETGEDVLKAGTKYLIFDMDNEEYVIQTTVYPNVVKFGTPENPYYTNDEGFLITPEKLRAGTYRIEEVEAPEGYVKQGFEVDVKAAVIIELNENTPVLVDGDLSAPAALVEQYNEPQKGKVRLVKTGEVLTKFDKGFTYQNDKLADVEFSLFAKEDIFTQDNQETLIFEKDKLIEIYKTNPMGLLEIKDLPIGEYYIVETEPKGFLKTEPISFVISPADDESAIIEVDLKVENIRQVFEIEILKVESGNKDKQLAGAVFEVYAADDIKDDYNKIIINKGALIDTKTTNTSGIAEFSNLPAGKYKVIEKEAPDGYLLNEDFELNITFEYDKNKEKAVTYKAICENDYTKLEISKKDIADEKELPGAKLELWKDEEIIDSWISGDKPHYLTHLEPGTYKLVETMAPDSYETTEDVTFELKATGEVQKVTMYDELKVVPETEESDTPVKSTPKNSPKTGDYTSVIMLLIVVLLSGGAIFGISIYKKAKR